MSQDQYWRPLGFLYGAEAAQAVECGIAGFLAGSTIAFQSVQCLSRGGKKQSEMRTYKDVSVSQDGSIVSALEKLTRPRLALAGLDFTHTHIMGIVNTTPDSFSDGGDFVSPEDAISHARELAGEGAHILDIGGESTRPGAQEVNVDEELARTLTVVQTLSKEGFLVSIDTRKSAVMSAAIKSGAAIINDVSAFQFDPASAQVAADAQCPVILMHAQGLPENMQDDPNYDCVVLDVFDALSGLIDRAVKAGVKKEHIIADPGIGFGKTYAHNLDIMDHLSLYHGLDVPLLVGASRKRFLGEATGEKIAKNRVSASVAAALCAVKQGVQIVRVHDVRETVQAINVVKVIQNR